MPSGAPPPTVGSTGSVAWSCQCGSWGQESPELGVMFETTCQAVRPWGTGDPVLQVLGHLLLSVM